MTPKGNSRANGISEREPNNETNCEADCNIARPNLAGALSVGGDGGSGTHDPLSVPAVLMSKYLARSNKTSLGQAIKSVSK
jgi:hypothetical protein